MATYLELAEISEQATWNDFLNKVRFAAVKKAQLVIDSTTPGATVLEWARKTIANKSAAGDAIVDYVLAAGSDSSVATILGATDTSILNHVSDAVDAIYGT